MCGWSLQVLRDQCQHPKRLRNLSVTSGRRSVLMAGHRTFGGVTDLTGWDPAVLLQDSAWRLVVARKPEVLVRRSSRWTKDEGRELQRITAPRRTPSGCGGRSSLLKTPRERPGAGKPFGDRDAASAIRDAYRRPVGA
jgi:hypothetical protein